MSSAKKGVLKAVGIITLLTLLSRFAGLFRKLAQSWAMSDGAVATAYDTSNTVPNVLFEVAAGGALAGAVIPLLSGFLARSMRSEAEQTASALLSWVALIGLPIAGIVAVAAEPISVALFGADANPSIIALAVVLLRMFAVQIPLYGFSVVFTGILQAHKKFVLPALAPLLNSIMVIAVFVVYGRVYGHDADPSALSVGSIVWLGWGTTAGVIVFSLPQLIPAMRLMKLRPRLRFPAGVARRTMRLAGAGLGALLAQQIAIIAIMVVANTSGGVGTYNTFNYAWAMFMVPYAVLAVPIATATFPHISAAVVAVHEEQSSDTGSESMNGEASCSRDEKSSTVTISESASALIAQSTRLVIAMGISAAAMLIVLAKPAQIVLEMGQPIEYLDTAMIAMGVGVAGYCIMYHGARVLYAFEQGRWVILSNSLGWGIIVAGLIALSLSGAQGRLAVVTGIGVSMSLGLLAGAGVIVAAIARVSGRKAVRGCGRMAVLSLLTQALCAVPAWYGVQAILAWLGSGFLGAVVSAILGAGILLAGIGAVVWFCDRDAIAALR